MTDSNLPEVWTVVTQDDFVDLKLNILDFDDSIGQALLQTDLLAHIQYSTKLKLL